MLAPGGEHKFLADHLIDGRILMPATSYVVTAWEALASAKGKPMDEVGVSFKDVIIHQAVAAEEGQKVALAVLLAPGNRFHVRLRHAWLVLQSLSMGVCLRSCLCFKEGRGPGLHRSFPVYGQLLCSLGAGHLLVLAWQQLTWPLYKLGHPAVDTGMN